MQDKCQQCTRKVNAGGAACVVLLVAATVVLGILPLYKNGKRDIEEAARLRTRLQAMESLEQALARVDQERKLTEGRLQEFETRLPSTAQTNAFISDLAKLTRGAGVRIDSTNYPKDLKECGPYRALPVEVSGVGDWESCYKFLIALRSTERLTRLDSLVLEADAKQPQPGERQVCHITAGLSTFFMDR